MHDRAANSETYLTHVIGIKKATVQEITPKWEFPNRFKWWFCRAERIKFRS